MMRGKKNIKIAKKNRTNSIKNCKQKNVKMQKKSHFPKNCQKSQLRFPGGTV